MEVPTTVAAATIQLGGKAIGSATIRPLMAQLVVNPQPVDLRKNSKQGSGSSSRKYARTI